jgi:hypothetical protein
VTLTGHEAADGISGHAVAFEGVRDSSGEEELGSGWIEREKCPFAVICDNGAPAHGGIGRRDLLDGVAKVLLVVTTMNQNVAVAARFTWPSAGASRKVIGLQRWAKAPMSSG